MLFRSGASFENIPQIPQISSKNRCKVLREGKGVFIGKVFYPSQTPRVRFHRKWRGRRLRLGVFLLPLIFFFVGPSRVYPRTWVITEILPHFAGQLGDQVIADATATVPSSTSSCGWSKDTDMDAIPLHLKDCI